MTLYPDESDRPDSMTFISITLRTCDACSPETTPGDGPGSRPRRPLYRQARLLVARVWLDKANEQGHGRPGAESPAIQALRRSTLSLAVLCHDSPHPDPGNVLDHLASFGRLVDHCVNSGAIHETTASELRTLSQELVAML